MNRNVWIVCVFSWLWILNAEDEDPASKSQQKAVSHLVQALKSVRLAIMNGSGDSGGGKPDAGKRPRNPFRSKQKFKLPEMPPGQNPYNQLSELVREQKKLNSELRKENGELNGKQTGKQDALRKKLDAVQQKLSGNEPASKKLAKADGEMKEASDYLKAEKRLPASVKGEQAAADMEQVRKKLERDSDRSTGKNLRETGKKLDNLSQKLKDGKQSGKQTRDALSDMASDLAGKAFREHQSGTQNNAERLGGVSERIHEAAESKPDKKLSEKERKQALLQTLDTLEKVVRAARSGQQDPASFLSTTLSQLNENADYLKYLKKHPDPAAEKEVREETDFLLEDLSSVLERIAEESTEWNVVKAREGAEKALADFRKSARNDPEKLPPVLEAAGKLLRALKREVRIHTFEAEEIPKKYRRAAAEYFERLSGGKQPSPEKP